MDLFTTLIVTNRNEITQKFNDYSKLCSQIWYFQRQQYPLCLLFRNVIFFFNSSIKGGIQLPTFEFGLYRLTCLLDWLRNALILAPKLLCSRKYRGPRQRELVSDSSHPCDVLTNGKQQKSLQLLKLGFKRPVTSAFTTWNTLSWTQPPKKPLQEVHLGENKGPGQQPLLISLPAVD